MTIEREREREREGERERNSKMLGSIPKAKAYN